MLYNKSIQIKIEHSFRAVHNFIQPQKQRHICFKKSSIRWKSTCHVTSNLKPIIYRIRWSSPESLRLKNLREDEFVPSIISLSNLSPIQPYEPKLNCEKKLSKTVQRIDLFPTRKFLNNKKLISGCRSFEQLSQRQRLNSSQLTPYCNNGRNNSSYISKRNIDSYDKFKKNKGVNMIRKQNVSYQIVDFKPIYKRGLEQEQKLKVDCSRLGIKNHNIINTKLPTKVNLNNPGITSLLAQRMNRKLITSVVQSNAFVYDKIPSECITTSVETTNCKPTVEDRTGSTSNRCGKTNVILKPPKTPYSVCKNIATSKREFDDTYSGRQTLTLKKKLDSTKSHINRVNLSKLTKATNAAKNCNHLQQRIGCPDVDRAFSLLKAFPSQIHNRSVSVGPHKKNTGPLEKLPYEKKYSVLLYENSQLFNSSSCLKNKTSKNSSMSLNLSNNIPLNKDEDLFYDSKQISSKLMDCDFKSGLKRTKKLESESKKSMRAIDEIPKADFCKMPVIQMNELKPGLMDDQTNSETSSKNANVSAMAKNQENLFPENAQVSLGCRENFEVVKSDQSLKKDISLAPSNIVRTASSYRPSTFLFNKYARINDLNHQTIHDIFPKNTIYFSTVSSVNTSVKEGKDQSAGCTENIMASSENDVKEDINGNICRSESLKDEINSKVLNPTRISDQGENNLEHSKKYLDKSTAAVPSTNNFEPKFVNRSSGKLKDSDFLKVVKPRQSFIIGTNNAYHQGTKYSQTEKTKCPSTNNSSQSKTKVGSDNKFKENPSQYSTYFKQNEKSKNWNNFHSKSNQMLKQTSDIKSASQLKVQSRSNPIMPAKRMDTNNKKNPSNLSMSSNSNSYQRHSKSNFLAKFANRNVKKNPYLYQQLNIHQADLLNNDFKFELRKKDESKLSLDRILENKKEYRGFELVHPPPKYFGIHPESIKKASSSIRPYRPPVVEEPTCFAQFQNKTKSSF